MIQYSTIIALYLYIHTIVYQNTNTNPYFYTQYRCYGKIYNIHTVPYVPLRIKISKQYLPHNPNPHPSSTPFDQSLYYSIERYKPLLLYN